MAKNIISNTVCPICDSTEAMLVKGTITCPECGYDEAYDEEIKENIKKENIKNYEDFN